MDILQPSQPNTPERREAERIALALNGARTSCVTAINSVKRKRSWAPSIRAVTIADYSERLESLRTLYEAFCELHNIRGY